MEEVGKVYCRRGYRSERKMTMELREFVSDTLAEIVEGVVKVQGTEHGGNINPHVRNPEADWRGHNVVNPRAGPLLVIVDFDVALTVTERGQLGGKITVMGTGIGGETGTEGTSVSRVKFSVPVSLPPGRQDL